MLEGLPIRSKSEGFMIAVLSGTRPIRCGPVGHIQTTHVGTNNHDPVLWVYWGCNGFLQEVFLMTHMTCKTIQSTKHMDSIDANY